MTAREIALTVLQGLEDREKKSGTLLHDLLEDVPLEQKDRSLATELVNGVLRRRMTLDAVIERFYLHRYDKASSAIKNILRIGAYQLLYLDRIPVWAAVSESVRLARKCKGERMARLVNAVLRKISPETTVREILQAESEGIRRMAIGSSHPEWLIERWLRRYGAETTSAILDYNNRSPLLGFRINTLKTTPETISASLPGSASNRIQAEGLGNFFLSESFTGFEPLLREGLLSVQNPTQGLACLLCGAHAGDTVLDLCAAPGGKSTFLAELMQDQGEITAVDRYPGKLENLKRHATALGISIIETAAADARSLVPPKQPAIILLDAPCSGSGVLGRRAELRWKLSPEKIGQLVWLQRELLEHTASLLGENGILVYATCSIEPEENELQIEEFLDRHPEFSRESQSGTLPEPFASKCSGGSILTLPGERFGFDGGFAQRLKKNRP